MKTKHRWETCGDCSGSGFTADNRLCPECGGDGCLLVLVEAEPTTAGLDRLIEDLAKDLFRG